MVSYGLAKSICRQDMIHIALTNSVSKLTLFCSGHAERNEVSLGTTLSGVTLQ